MLKKISVIGILTCILYFISVGLFLITKADIALTIWELMTVISGPLVLLVMIGLAEFLSAVLYLLMKICGIWLQWHMDLD